MNDSFGSSVFSLPDRYAESGENSNKYLYRLATKFLFPLREAFRTSGTEYDRVTQQYNPREYMSEFTPFMRKIGAWGDVVLDIGSALLPQVFLVPKLFTLLAPLSSEMASSLTHKIYPDKPVQPTQNRMGFPNPYLENQEPTTVNPDKKPQQGNPMGFTLPR